MENYKKVMWGSAAAASIVIALLVVFLFLPGKKDNAGEGTPINEAMTGSPPTPTPTGEITTGTQETPTAEPLDIDLNNSDSTVRELLQTISNHPGFGQWLENTDLVRKTTAVVENIANGESPKAHLKFLEPKKKFAVIEKNGRIVLDPDSYKRYDAMTDVFCSMDTKTCAVLFYRMKPLIDRAFADLGYPKDSFNSTLYMAINLLRDVPVVENDIFLEEKVTTYVFSDPKLENLSLAQKHLLRMGPRNIKRIQQKLKEIAGSFSPGG